MNESLKAQGPKFKGFQGPNTIMKMVFGPINPIIWFLGPLGNYGLDPIAQLRALITYNPT